MQENSQSFPKSYRLTKTDEFSSVFSFRKAVKSTHFLLHYRVPDTETEHSPVARLGLVVAKRFLKRAVDRNLVKRLAREQFRILQSLLYSRDYVLRLRVKPEILDKKALAEEIKKLLHKMCLPSK